MLSMRAKGDEIVSPRACNQTVWIVIGITVSSGTGILKETRERSRPARLGIAIGTRATILRRTEGKAGTLTSHDTALLVLHLKRRRAAEVQVADAPGICAFARASAGSYGNGKIVAIHQAHVVEVLGAQGDLGQRGWWRASGTVAVELASAVTRGTKPLPVAIKGATVATPYSTRPSRGWNDGHGL